MKEYYFTLESAVKLLEINEQQFFYRLKRARLKKYQKMSRTCRDWHQYRAVRFYSEKLVAEIGVQVRNEKADLFMERYGFYALGCKSCKPVCRIESAEEFWRVVELPSEPSKISPSQMLKALINDDFD